MPQRLTRRCSWHPGGGGGGRRAGAWCTCASLAALLLPRLAAPDVVPTVFMGPPCGCTPHFCNTLG
jgi:hypothetical protein